MFSRLRLLTLVPLAVMLAAGGDPAAAKPRVLSGTLQLVPGEGRAGQGFLLDTGRRVHRLSPRQPAGLAGRRVTVRDSDPRRRGIQGRVRAVAQARAAAAGSPAWRARPRKVAVIRVVWSAGLDDPAPADTVATVMHDAANANDAFFRAQTGGALQLRGALDSTVDVLPAADGAPAAPLVVPRPATCDQYALADAVRAAIPTATLAQYDHLTIAFPRIDSCGWDGLGTLANPLLADATTHWTWINGAFTSPYARWVVAHELGHNLGAGHAATATCREGTRIVQLSASCALTDVYGDPFDVMGGYGLPPDSYRLMSAWNRVQTGQLTASAVTTASAGVHDLTDVNAPGSAGTRTLLVPRAGTGDYLALEHRGPLSPFDDWAAGTGPAAGVLVRLVEPIGSAGADTMLLDMTPATATTSDAALPAGQSLTDPVSGSTIAVLAAGDGSARVQISQLAPQPPAAGPPPARTPPPGGAVTAPGAAPPPAAKMPVLRMTSPKLRRGSARLPKSRRITLTAAGATKITAKVKGRRRATTARGERLRLRLTAKQRRSTVVTVTATGNAPAATVHLTLRVRRGAITIVAR